MSDLVYWSVAECNRLYAHQAKPIGEKCPKCSNDEWETYWGVDERFASEYNPGEYCQWTCVHCGYSSGPQQS